MVNTGLVDSKADQFVSSTESYNVCDSLYDQLFSRAENMCNLSFAVRHNGFYSLLS